MFGRECLPFIIPVFPLVGFSGKYVNIKKNTTGKVSPHKLITNEVGHFKNIFLPFSATFSFETRSQTNIQVKANVRGLN